MDFLDSLDVDSKYRKAHRVRSWYLYEQYKSLERHQLDAVHKLKNRSYQNRILRQELTERKARRNLYDRFGGCQSESNLENDDTSQRSHSKMFTSVSEDFLETFGDEQITTEMEFEEDNSSNHSSVANKSVTEDYKSADEQKDEASYSESVDSVVENVPKVLNEYEACDFEYGEDSRYATVAEELNKKLDSVQQHIHSMKRIATMDDEYNTTESVAAYFYEDNVDECTLEMKKQEYNNVFAVWSRVVSFAYRLVQLNYGNCYCDYSSQFLTAVLACDVLRRGLNCMCNILQPFTSPVKFSITDDESEVSECCYKNAKTKNCILLSKKSRKADKKPCRNYKPSKKSSRRAHRNYSDLCWRTFNKQSHIQQHTSLRRASEPWQCSPKAMELIELSSTSASSILWPFERRRKVCKRCRHEMSPMLKVARYIDSILNDTDDT